MGFWPCSFQIFEIWKRWSKILYNVKQFPPKGLKNWFWSDPDNTNCKMTLEVIMGKDEIIKWLLIKECCNMLSTWTPLNIGEMLFTFSPFFSHFYYNCIINKIQYIHFRFFYSSPLRYTRLCNSVHYFQNISFYCKIIK